MADCGRSREQVAASRQSDGTGERDRGRDSQGGQPAVPDRLNTGSRQGRPVTHGCVPRTRGASSCPGVRATSSDFRARGRHESIFVSSVCGSRSHTRVDGLRAMHAWWFAMRCRRLRRTVRPGRGLAADDDEVFGRREWSRQSQGEQRVRLYPGRIPVRRGRLHRALHAGRKLATDHDEVRALGTVRVQAGDGDACPPSWRHALHACRERGRADGAVIWPESACRSAGARSSS